jgi:chromosome partitioning protein
MPAAGLAQSARRVLLVDLDPQGNATMGSGVNKSKLERTVYTTCCSAWAMARIRTRVEKRLRPRSRPNRDLAGAEVELVDAAESRGRLRPRWSERRHYDFILIDCPPSLSLLTVNAFAAAEQVLIPMQCEYYALEGCRISSAPSSGCART